MVQATRMPIFLFFDVRGGNKSLLATNNGDSKGHPGSELASCSQSRSVSHISGQVARWSELKM